MGYTKQFDKLFLNGYLHAIADGRCQFCNEKYRRFIPSFLPHLSRLLGSRRRLAFEMNRQHIVPASVLKLGKVIEAAKLKQYLPNLTAKLDRWRPFPREEETWEPREPNDPSVARNHQDLILVCQSHNTAYDAAIKTFAEDVTSKLRSEQRINDPMFEMMEEGMINRIERLLTMRQSTDLPCRLLELHKLDWRQYHQLKDELISWLEQPSTQSERLQRWRARWLSEPRLSRTSNRHMRAYDRTYNLIMAMYSLPGAFPWRSLSSLTVRSLHNHLVHMRHIVKGMRICATENTLGPILPEKNEQYVTHKDAAQSLAVSVLKRFRDHLRDWFDVENALDFFLEWIRQLPNAKDLRWRRSTMEDLVHLLSFRNTFRHCARYFDYSHYVPRYVPELGSSPHTLFERLVPQFKMAIEAGAFLLQAEGELRRTTRRCRRLVIGGREQLSLRALISGTATVNSLSWSSLDRILLSGRGSIKDRIESALNRKGKQYVRE